MTIATAAPPDRRGQVKIGRPLDEHTATCAGGGWLRPAPVAAGLPVIEKCRGCGAVRMVGAR